MTQVRVIWDGAAVLGEGPAWDERDGCLWFVDIKQRLIHRVDPVSGKSRSWQAPAQVGWVLPAAKGGFLAGLQGGLYHFTPDDGEFRCVAEIETDQPGNRLNDATIGPDGTVWFGTMDDAIRDKTGSVYRWNGETVERTSIPFAVVTNGPGITPDGHTMYHVDTLAGVVQSFPLGPEGIAGPGNEFIRVSAGIGHPDGVTVDSAGNIWMGVWGGSCARCYSPDGTLLQQVEVPAPNVTKVALGGERLSTAFVTTARADLDSTALARAPHSGAVFAFDVTVPGQSLPLAPV